MKVFYSEANYGQEEIEAAVDVLKNSRLCLMNGTKVRELEKEVAKLFSKRFALMTNSGSSANLLSMMSSNLPKGSLVITPSLTFSTTVAPIVQAGFIPLFVDVEENTLQIDPNLIEDACKKYGKDISAIFVPNLIGNVANWDAIRIIANKYHLEVYEDSADTIGYKYQTTLNENLTDVTTTSMYASHVVTGAGFGGVVCFNDESRYKYAQSLRSWGRRSSRYEESEDFERRFAAQIDGFDYDDKYIFDDLGYNLIPSEISAAFGLVQIKNLNNNISHRIENFNFLSQALNIDDISLFNAYSNVETGWLAFPIMLSGRMEGKRKEFQIYLEKNNVQTRTIFTGNILRQPVAKKFKHASFGTFDVSDRIMQNGVLLGCHNQMTKEKLDYQVQIVQDAIINISN